MSLPNDTYEHVRTLADQQIAKEKAITDKLDAEEQYVLDFWDDFIEIPYGRKYTVRIKADMSSADHMAFCTMLDKVNTVSDESDTMFMDALEMITMGIYDGDTQISDTDKAFWSNNKNWSMSKIKRIIEAYFQHFKEETERTFSFLETPT